MKNEKIIALFQETVCLLRDLSLLSDVFFAKGNGTLGRAYLRTEMSFTSMVPEGPVKLGYPDAILSYFPGEDKIVVYCQKDHLYYAHAWTELSPEDLTPEKLVDIFLSANPILKKTTLSLLVGIDYDE